jgi:hypothetical protein
VIIDTVVTSRAALVLKVAFFEEKVVDQFHPQQPISTLVFAGLDIELNICSLPSTSNAREVVPQVSAKKYSFQETGR